MKIVEYKVLHCNVIDDSDFKQGWQPWGSPFRDKNGDDCQAMVRYESSPPVIGEASLNVGNVFRENEIMKSREKTREDTILAQLKLIEHQQTTIIELNRALSLLTTPRMVPSENS